ncbi:MAG: hypothetical protein ABII79_04280 [bacterium]
MKLIMPVILLLLIPAHGVPAAGETPDGQVVEITVAAQLLQLSGYTQYEMDLRGMTDTGLAVLGSRLEFPVDVAMAGCRIRFQMTTKGGNVWWLEGSVFASLDNPGKVMKDTDWSKRLPNRAIDDFYTESPVEMKSILMTLEGGRRLLQRGYVNLSAWGGLRYQHIHQDINGWDGWYLDSNLVRYDWRGTLHGIVYKVTHIQPHLGLLADIAPDGDISLELRAAYAPVITSDFDDHVLRNKIAESSLIGHGVLSGVKLRFLLCPSRHRPTLELTGDYLYLHASGDQQQTWYGDDPMTPGVDDTGRKVTGIPHEISSRQASIGVSLGLVF